ncbi:DUF2478 domain-containing protein [Sedimentitalea sp. JM2-8]|uniref:DUF2478 domain-containing protein n=1 Tax=Sedimentitalea xiamensis TaxID=3050037 RepID=A0ABT7FES9_9RHOB|nr:DUF2478 domain-containing protein [Sedimentitalea xiamensis]MDK3073630.1 DUF2478 domain-containing protein [Sedimentitalea xiamensis]
MRLATVSAEERGETDRLLEAVVAQLRKDGFKVLGALKATGQDGANIHCNSDLWLLPDGPVVRIMQDLGTGSSACRMDAAALEDGVGLSAARLAAEGADLIVLNKFGLSEAEGRGFRTLIAEALGRGVPVLTGLTDTHRCAFERFADGMETALPPEEAAILNWCRTAVRPHPTIFEEV